MDLKQVPDVVHKKVVKVYWGSLERELSGTQASFEN